MSLELPLLPAQTDRSKFANIAATDFRLAWSMNAKDNAMVPFQHVELALRWSVKNLLSFILQKISFNQYIVNLCLVNLCMLDDYHY